MAQNMIQSMTGFGKASCDFQGKKIVAEVKSLNSKQVDVSARMSSMYREKEIQLRKLISSSVVRGKIDFALYVDNSSVEVSSQLNANVLANYQRQIKEIAEQTGLPEPADWFSLLVKMPDAMKAEQQDLCDEEWAVAQQVASEALQQLKVSRTTEGEGLSLFLLERVDAIEALLKEVPKYEKIRVDKIRTRLEENLKSLEDKISYDSNRLEQELIFYVEKLDVSEEKQRLSSHLTYFRDTIKDKEAVGKKLGFISQEMGREINTLGSKANHDELQIVVVKMKDELEKIKEQVLNVL